MVVTAVEFSAFDTLVVAVEAAAVSRQVARVSQAAAGGREPSGAGAVRSRLGAGATCGFRKAGVAISTRRSVRILRQEGARVLC